MHALLHADNACFFISPFWKYYYSCSTVRFSTNRGDNGFSFRPPPPPPPPTTTTTKEQQQQKVNVPISAWKRLEICRLGVKGGGGGGGEGGEQGEMGGGCSVRLFWHHTVDDVKAGQGRPSGAPACLDQIKQLPTAAHHLQPSVLQPFV